MVDLRPGEVAPCREVGDAAEAARFLVDCAGNLDRAREIRPAFQEGLDRDDRGGEPALHVAGAAAIDPAIGNGPTERIDRPAFAGLDHVDMRVEMDRGAGTAALDARHHVDARVEVAVARRALGAHELDGKAAFAQSLCDVFRARPVGVARRVDGRKADEVGGQRGEFVAARADPAGHAVFHAAN